jgi:nucleotide-binding universal stress UspA family protein
MLVCHVGPPAQGGRKASMSSVSGDAAVIVVGVDGSTESAAALSWAVDEARLRGATLKIVHAFPALMSFFGTTAHEYYPQVEKEAHERFDAILAAAPPMDGLEVAHTVVPGNPAEVLVGESRGATMLVVGSRGHGSFRGMLLGSVSIHTAQLAHCPVLVVREDH